jgi:hypothetical protein
MEAIFEKIYRNRSWGGSSRSGTGSELRRTMAIRSELPHIIAKYGITSLLDIPCGDFYWMRHSQLQLESYIGADVVQEIVDRNNASYASNAQSFLKLDVTQDTLPKVDLIFCRDLLVHLSYRDIARALARIWESGSEFLMTTSFTRWPKNQNIATGEWRPLNLEIAPFDFPKPVLVLNERCEEGAGQFSDKSLLMWRMQTPDSERTTEAGRVPPRR